MFTWRSNYVEFQNSYFDALSNNEIILNTFLLLDHKSLL